MRVRDTLDPEEKQNKQSTELLLNNSVKVDATIPGIPGLREDAKNT